jgi:hypothetical protein
MGKALKTITKPFVGDKNAGGGAMEQSNALMERAVRELEKIGIPSIEAQEIVLANPDLILSSAEEKLGQSAYEDMALDPRLQGVQKQALQEMMQRGETGFTPEDIARFESLREQISGDEQARQKSILSSMAQRGALDSGAQLAQQLSSSQGAAQRAAQASRDIAGQASQARQGALSQAANMAQGMEAQGLQLQGQKASAKDRISEFNAAVAQRDTGAKQAQAQNLAQTANQQPMYNKGLIQQNFQNQMSKATGMGSALGNQAGMFANQASMQANAAQNTAAGNRALLGMVKDTGMKFAGMADGGIKYSEGSKYFPYDTPEYDPKYAQQLGKPTVGENMINTVGSSISNVAAKLGAAFGDEKSKAYLAQNPEMRTPEESKTPTEKVEAPKDVMGETKSAPTSTPEAQIQEFKPTFQPSQIQYDPGQTQSTGMLAKIRQQIVPMSAADGGRKMAYEDNGEGTIIPGESFEGDKLDDNINSGEMVSNLKQQNRLNQLLLELKELKGGKRVDSMVQSGEAEVNPDQQEELMSVLRGEKDVTELPEKNVVDPKKDILEEILQLLSEDEE